MPMSKGFASTYRIVLLAIGLFGCMGALGVRLVWLHVIDRDALIKTISETRQQLIVEHAKRGDIRDERGAILATSHSSIVLGVDPHALLAKEWVKWPRFSRLTGIPLAELREIFIPRYRDPVTTGAPVEAMVKLDLPGASPAPAPAVASPELTLPVLSPVMVDTPPGEATVDDKDPRKIRWVKLREGITEEQFAIIRKLNLAGIRGERVYTRSYPNKQLASHIIGYVNKQQQPVAGIEAQSDFYLRGQSGWRVGERDGRNRELAQFNTRKVAPSDGYNVFLSINTIVQDIVEQELAHIAQRFEPLKASIVVSDPRTGFILGMGNYPTFDPNAYNEVPESEMSRMKNAAVADIYDPGSVFKIVPAAAALEEGLVTPMSVFDCEVERVVYNNRTLKLPGEDHRMGHLTVGEIISHSSNRGAAQLGLKLGAENLYKYATAFGFGFKLGFPVGGEVSGILHPYKKWNPGDIVIIPMGHSISSTVLQMHQAMSVIAADGVLLRPQVIREIRDGQGDVLYHFERQPIGRAISPETARKVAVMLTGVTRRGGTAVEASIEGFDVAGKTGTSQKFINGEWSKKHHIASFVGFFPAAQPRVVISVIVDDADHRAPNGVAYGRTVAAPSFKRLGERLIPVLDDIQFNRPTTPGSALIAATEGGRR